MRLGVNVPNFGPGTEPGVLRRWAQTVEGLGFDLLMISDHIVAAWQALATVWAGTRHLEEQP